MIQFDYLVCLVFFGRFRSVRFGLVRFGLVWFGSGLVRFSSHHAMLCMVWCCSTLGGKGGNGKAPWVLF
jgi:hypothetical protein